jgi:hypothetical protein
MTGPSFAGVRADTVRVLLVVLLVAAAACDSDLPTNPNGPDGGGGSGGGAGGGGSTVDPELGGPCIEDAQCDDGVDCTMDSCDSSVDRCRFVARAELCDDGVHCNGIERCVQKLGCQAGPPVSCGDDDICTIDTCVENSKSCRYEPRDADSDGDVDVHCGGGDCDETNPEVSSAQPEVCGNGVDDDCDLTIDEDDCATPMNDTCADPVLVDAPGLYVLSSFGASFHYATSCTPEGPVGDVVAAVVVPDGEPQDVVVRARASSTALSTAVAGQCGDASTELACGPSYSTPAGGFVSKLRARSVPPATYPLYVSTSSGDTIQLDVGFEPASAKPANETCGTALPLPTGAPFEVEIVDATDDHETACASATGELVYELTLTETSDLAVWASSLDGDGNPSLSILEAPCTAPSDEISCATAPQANLYRHELPPGSYFLAVSSTAPSRVSVNAIVLPPSPAPAEDVCETAPTLEPTVPVEVSYGTLQDDENLPCFQAAKDAAFAVSLDDTSDVLLVNRLSAGDSASLGLGDASCTTFLSCAAAGTSPLRLRRRNLPAGDYRVVTESLGGFPQELTALVRPHAPTLIVPFADACDDVFTIPPAGAFLQGNTSNQSANFSAGCDADGPPAGAEDQLLRLVLDEPKRIVLDTSGSGYNVMLSVRKGPSCPGVEVPLGCTASIASNPAFLDLELDAGTYFVQVDGLAGATGPWFLDVFVVDP